MTHRELKIKEASGTVVSVGDSRVQPHIDATTSVHGIADTSQLATKSYADNAAATAAAAVVDAAPTTLNTLNELAAALGDDANFATTVTTSLAQKVDLTDSRLTDERVPTDGSVTTSKIADGAVTAAKLAAGAAVPSQAGNASKFLTTDGSTASWKRALVNTRDGFKTQVINGPLGVRGYNNTSLLQFKGRMYPAGKVTNVAVATQNVDVSPSSSGANKSVSQITYSGGAVYGTLTIQFVGEIDPSVVSVFSSTQYLSLFDGTQELQLQRDGGPFQDAVAKTVFFNIYHAAGGLPATATTWTSPSVYLRVASTATTVTTDVPNLSGTIVGWGGVAFVLGDVDVPFTQSTFSGASVSITGDYSTSIFVDDLVAVYLDEGASIEVIKKAGGKATLWFDGQHWRQEGSDANGAQVEHGGKAFLPRQEYTDYGKFLVSDGQTASWSSTVPVGAVLDRPVITSPLEVTKVSATAATGTVAFDAITQGVLYYTTNASGNWTLNIRGDGSNTLNSILAVGSSITVAFLVTQGATAFSQTALTIDGAAQTVRWQGGTAPSSGNVNSIDVYTFTIIKTASSPAYTVLGQKTRFA